MTFYLISGGKWKIVKAAIIVKWLVLGHVNDSPLPTSKYGIFLKILTKEEKTK